MYKSRMTRKELLIEQISEEVYLRILCEQYGYDPRRLEEAGFRDYLKGAGVAAAMTFGGMSGQAQAPAMTPNTSKEIKFIQARTPQDTAQNVASYKDLEQHFKSRTGYNLAGLDEILDVQLKELMGDTTSYDEVLEVVKELNVTNPIKSASFEGVRGLEGTVHVNVSTKDTILVSGLRVYKITADSKTVDEFAKKVTKNPEASPILITVSDLKNKIIRTAKQAVLYDFIDFITRLDFNQTIPTKNGHVMAAPGGPIGTAFNTILLDKLNGYIDAFNKGGGGFSDEHMNYDLKTGEALGFSSTSDRHRAHGMNIGAGYQSRPMKVQGGYPIREVYETLKDVLQAGQADILKTATGKSGQSAFDYLHWAALLMNNRTNPYIFFNAENSASHIVSTCLNQEAVKMEESKRVFRRNI